MPDRASGFCYVNDAVLAIMRLRERGWRVAYVDIDAHHGDGVQFAFYRDPNVLTVSTHERGDRLFPGTGFVTEMGDGEGRGFSVNLPLQPFTDDAVYAEAFEAVVPPIVAAFKPDALVLQLGIDSHRTDPLTHLALTIQGFTAAVRRLLPLRPARGGARRGRLRPAERGARVDGGLGRDERREPAGAVAARVPPPDASPRSSRVDSVGPARRAARGHAAVGRGIRAPSSRGHPGTDLPPARDLRSAPP